MNKLIVGLASTFLLSACAAPGGLNNADEAIQPQPGAGAIGISLRGYSPTGADRLLAAEVWFVRIQSDGDKYAAQTLIPSNPTKAQMAAFTC